MANVELDRPLEFVDEIFALGQHVRHRSEDDEEDISDHHAFILEELLLRELSDEILVDTLDAIEGKMHRVESKVGDVGIGTDYVVAHGLDKFAGLGLGHLRLLLVTAINEEVYVLSGLVYHALGFAAREFDQIATDLNDNAFELTHVRLFEDLVARGDAHELNQLYDGLRVELIFD